VKSITSEKFLAETVAKMILNAKHLVVFTGAGISTESGLSDFRGKDGVWTRRDKGLPPKPSPRFDEVSPNSAHKAIVELQELGIMKFLISQNVDNLHLKSGIKPSIIAELHGNYTIMKCTKCDKRYTREEIDWIREKHGRGFRTDEEIPGQPRCKMCHGRIISSVINFNDPMPKKEMKAAKEHVEKCDLLLVIGSSLTVYPAANFPKIAKKNGAKVVIINIDPTKLDDLTDMKIKQKAGIFLPKVIEQIKRLSTNLN